MKVPASGLGKLLHTATLKSLALQPVAHQGVETLGNLPLGGLVWEGERQQSNVGAAILGNKPLDVLLKSIDALPLAARKLAKCSIFHDD